VSRETRRVVVTGVGVLCPLGDSPAAVHAALVAGESGLAPVAAFATDGLPCRLAGEVKDFAPARYLGEANFRPLDRTARLAAVAAHLAFADAGLPAAARGEREVGLVLGTMFGSVHTISEFDRRALTAGPNYAKPMDFANSVINAAAGQTAIWHDLRGVNTTITGGSTAGVQALGYAADLVRSGRVETVLAGGADELCFESFLGYARTGQLCGAAGGEGCPVPFDARRNGFALGEGAALLLLEEAGAARARGARIRAEIAGQGSAYDPTRGADAGTALARAVRLALGGAGLAPGRVDAVAAGANGSVAGDRQEAAGIAAALGAAAAAVPVTAVKASLGEGLGVSGALSAAALLGSMEGGTLPGIAGLGEVEEGFPLPGATAAPHPVDLRHGLVTAIGLDGAAAALLLARWEP
jgi:3-oxoacyl-(acyl-carrier-protein) synthase